jgi:virginiamycin B lyase
MRFNSAVNIIALVLTVSACSPNTATPSSAAQGVNEAESTNPIQSSFSGGFGLLLGFPKPSPLTIDVSEANYSKPFTVSGAAPAIKTSCSPKTCKPTLAGAQVSISVAPVAAGSGSLGISDAHGNSLSLPYRVSSIVNFPKLPYVFAAGCVGSDGNLWTETIDAAQGNDVTVVNAKGIVVATYPLPSGYAFGGLTCATGPDRAIWFPDAANAVDRISTDSRSLGRYMSYQLPSGSQPKAIAAGSDGNLWLVESSGYVDRMTTKGSVTQIPIVGRPSLDAIVAGPDGALWFSNSTASQQPILGRITTKGVVNIYPAPVPIWILASGTQRLWFFSHVDYAVEVCDSTTSGKMSCASTQLGEAETTSATRGPDGAVWLSYCVPGSGACTAGLLRVTEQGQQINYPFPASASAADVPAALMDGPGKALWIGGVNPRMGLSKLVP